MSLLSTHRLPRAGLLALLSTLGLTCALAAGILSGQIIGGDDVPGFLTDRPLLLYPSLIVMLPGIILLFFNLGRFLKEFLTRPKLSPQQIRQIEKKNSQIHNLLQASQESALRQAVIEMDALFDYAVVGLGYRGTVADKIKSIEPLLSDIEPLWKAHKLRNRLVHEMNTQLNSEQAHRAVLAFEKALQDLKVL